MKPSIARGLIVLLLLAALVSGCTKETDQQGTGPAEEEPITIGLSMADLRVERWQTDKRIFTERVEELGASVIVTTADLNAESQTVQAENLILQGVDVLVVIAHDSVKAAEIVEKAHAAGIKVIAYDRLILDSDLDYYISFDNIKVGEEEAKGVLAVVNKGNFVYLGGSQTDNNAFLVKQGTFNVLQPLIDAGDVNLVLDVFNDGWKSEEAYRQLNELLESGQTVDAVIAANDGTASGAIQALAEHGLAGKVPVSGQDASLGGCQNIIKGTQTVSVYKPLSSIATKAAEMAVAAAKDEAVETNTVVSNGMIDVSSYLLDVVAVNKDNMMDTIIKDGFHTYDEVYQDAAVSG